MEVTLKLKPAYASAASLRGVDPTCKSLRDFVGSNPTPTSRAVG